MASVLAGLGCSDGAVERGGGAEPAGDAGMAMVSRSRLGARHDHTCVLSDEGTARCWGPNNHGQLGDGTNTGEACGVLEVCKTSAVAVVGIEKLRAVEAGKHHSCASDGHKLWCWGENAGGQLGLGRTGGRMCTAGPTCEPAPLEVEGVDAIVDIAAGERHTCASDPEGEAWCWGANATGQLGDGTTDPHTTPQAVTGLHGVVRLASALATVCAVLDDASLVCWGANDKGQLGTGERDMSAHPEPARVPDLAGIVDVALAAAHGCAVDTDGRVWCWGASIGGVLGSATAATQPPREVAGVKHAVEVTVGLGHSCARNRAGEVWCWGSNAYGQLGRAPADAEPHPEPARVEGIPDPAIALAAGDEHVCALLDDGNVWCWGSNALAALAQGALDSDPHPDPVPVMGL